GVHPVQMFRSWNATCPRGAEPALEGELRALGAKGVRPGQGIVRFTGEREIALRACLDLRTALRVLEPVGEFAAVTADELYAGAKQLPWGELILKGQTIAVAASGRAEALTNTHFVEQRLKDAVVDVLRDRHGFRPDVDPRAPDVLIVAHLGNGQCSVSIDLAGELLSNRGYRVRAVEATRANARAAGVQLRIEQADVRQIKPMDPPGQLFLNVPYGERLEAGGRKQLKTFYHQLGDALRGLPGHRATILSGNEDFESAFGVRPRGPRRVLWNGPLRCALLGYVF